MREALRFLDFVHLPSYTRSARGLITDDEQRDLEQTLLANPEAGATIAGSGGVRKIRLALRGRGKRSGVRVIYFYRRARQRVYLILAYSKNVQESITDGEKQQIRKLTTALEAEP